MTLMSMIAIDTSSIMKWMLMMVTKLWLSTFAFYSQFQFHPSACELYSLYTARGEKVSGKITILFHKNYHIIFSVYFTAVAVKKI